MFSLGEASRLDTVDPAEWDTLALDASIYASWQWLRMGEDLIAADSPGVRTSYVLARDPNGRLVGALPTYPTSALNSRLYDPRHVFADLMTGSLSSASTWFPGIMAGGRSGYRTQLLVHPDLRADEREVLVTALVRHCQRQVDDGAAEAAWFMYLPTTDAMRVSHTLGDGCVRLFTAVEMSWDVRWKTFDEYLAALPRNRRTSIRRERAVFRSSYPNLRVTTLDQVADQLAPLYANLLEKYGGEAATERAQRYLRHQAAHLADRSTVWVCEDSSGPVGFSLFYRFADGLYSRFVGFDYPRANSFEYFNLLFYEPLEYALAEGLRTVHFGISSEEGKLRRGATPQPLWSVLYRRDGFPEEVTRAAREYNVRQIREFGRRHATAAVDGLELDTWACTA